MWSGKKIRDWSGFSFSFIAIIFSGIALYQTYKNQDANLQIQIQHHLNEAQKIMGDGNPLAFRSNLTKDPRQLNEETDKCAEV